MKRQCLACYHSWWSQAKPVDMPDSERTLDNGGLGECRYRPPEAMPNRAMRFPIISPHDRCGKFTIAGIEADLERIRQAKDGDVVMVVSQPEEIRLAQFERVAELAVELFKPPWRSCGGIRLSETDKIQDQRMDALSEALVEAGFGWEEWT